MVLTDEPLIDRATIVIVTPRVAFSIDVNGFIRHVTQKFFKGMAIVVILLHISYGKGSVGVV